ncbi:uncharacterized protein B0H64DRAFT_383896 [Chaetomium fimeti]|uniref:Uncharacterized protein n=1 Tax=Chaetomium fimeti TaxID=1854472 RepID=A0AAE0LYN0_9PEZI|nr:hypothetical protein B0H64DRAFT_383896 [Chaetomium fimeti]
MTVSQCVSHLWLPRTSCIHTNSVPRGLISVSPILAGRVFSFCADIIHALRPGKSRLLPPQGVLLGVGPQLPVTIRTPVVHLRRKEDLQVKRGQRKHPRHLYLTYPYPIGTTARRREENAVFRVRRFEQGRDCVLSSSCHLCRRDPPVREDRGQHETRTDRGRRCCRGKDGRTLQIAAGELAKPRWDSDFEMGTLRSTNGGWGRRWSRCRLRAWELGVER